MGDNDSSSLRLILYEQQVEQKIFLQLLHFIGGKRALNILMQFVHLYWSWTSKGISRLSEVFKDLETLYMNSTICFCTTKANLFGVLFFNSKVSVFRFTL